MDYWTIPIWKIIDDEKSFLRVRISPTAETFAHKLYEDHLISFFAHYTEGRERLVGYSLYYTKEVSCYFQEWYVALYSNSKVQNRDIVKLYGDPAIRLFSFNQKKDRNYALLVRIQTPKKRRAE